MRGLDSGPARAQGEPGPRAQRRDDYAAEHVGVLRNHVFPLGQVLPRAQELAEQMTQRPHLTNKYIAVVFRQRVSRRLAEGTLAGMALESLTAANLAYLQQG